LHGDEDVNVTAFSILSGNFTGTLGLGEGDKIHTDGDFDSYGDVDFSDFSVLAGNFTGTITTPATGSNTVKTAASDRIAKQPRSAQDSAEFVSLLAFARPLQRADPLQTVFSHRTSSASLITTIAGTTTRRLRAEALVGSSFDGSDDEPPWSLLGNAALEG